MRERGAIGFKAFMSETGMDDFRPADHMTLWEGMQRAAELGAIVAVHAENNRIIDAAAQRAVAAGLGDARTYLASRPPVAETEAIASVIALATDTGCRVHIVHVSTRAGIELVRSAQAAGVDVSCETVTHYLALTELDVERHRHHRQVRARDARRGEPRAAVGVRRRVPRARSSPPTTPPARPSMKETDDFFRGLGRDHGLPGHARRPARRSRARAALAGRGVGRGCRATSRIASG